MEITVDGVGTEKIDGLEERVRMMAELEKGADAATHWCEI